MEPIELYDIITLEDGEEYTAIKILNEDNKKYLLLAWTNEDENIDLEKIKIVKEIKKNDKILIEEVDDEGLLKKLSKTFLESLKDDLNEE